MKPRTLPKGWKEVRLGDVTVSCRYGLTARSRVSDSGVPYLRISDIDDSGRVTSSLKTVPAAMAETEKYALDPGDLLIARSGSVGRAYLHGKVETPWVFASYLIRFRLNTEVAYPKFIFHYAHSPQYWRYVETVAHTAAQPNINAEELKRLPIPLPPLPEQRRIVARIEELMTRIEEAKRLRKEASDATTHLLPSALRDAFGNVRSGYQVSNVPPSEAKGITEVCTLQRGKFSHRPRNDPRFFGGSIPWIQINDIPKDGKFIETYSDTLNEQGLAISKLFPKGTIVISIAATIGAVGVLSFDACFPDSLVGITPYSDFVRSSFLYYQLCFIQSHLDSIAPYAAQKNINIRILSKLKLWVPSPKMQGDIEGKLDGILRRSERVGRLQHEARKEMDGVISAVLRNAFEGRL